MTTIHRHPLPWLALAMLAGCAHITVDPIKVEPIDITLHIYLEADQKLDEFFGDSDSTPKTPAPPPPPTSTTPSSPAASQPEGAHQ